MEKKFKRTLVTTALPYANGPVHIGHLAGVYVPADIYTRFLRMRGEDVVMIGGSDEHGVPITIKAKAEGVTPQDIVDRYHKIIKDSFEELGVSFDIYSRTTSDIHSATASEFFRRLYDNGQFVEKSSMQLYDEKANQFLADRYVTGECPHCHNERAYGDQCEACGSSLNATDLINPKSAITGNTPVLKETKHWYLPLDRWEKALSEWILEVTRSGRAMFTASAILARHGPAAPRREPRPVVGCPRACGRRRGQGSLCVVRRSHRIHIEYQGADARQLGNMVERP